MSVETRHQGVDFKPDSPDRRKKVPNRLQKLRGIVNSGLLALALGTGPVSADEAEPHRNYLGLIANNSAISTQAENPNTWNFTMDFHIGCDIENPQGPFNAARATVVTDTIPNTNQFYSGPDGRIEGKVSDRRVDIYVQYGRLLPSGKSVLPCPNSDPELTDIDLNEQNKFNFRVTPRPD